MQYEVRALSANHVMSTLVVDAGNEVEARRQVEAQGAFVAAIAPARSGLFATGGKRAAAGRLSLVLFSQELLALLNAGLSIVECLEALLEKEAAGASSSILSRLLAGLREGKRFSSVLAEQGDVFPPLYVGIVRTAEGTSDLPHALRRFVDYQQRIDSVRSKIVSAAIYPVILLCVGGGVSAFLIGYVVPRFAAVYEGAGRNLPWMSQLLLSWGQFASAHTRTLALAALAVAVVLALGVSRFVARGGMGKAIAILPGIGSRARIYQLSRLYLTLGMLLEGGIPIIAAMETVEDIVSAEIRLGLKAAREMIASGAPLSTAFEANQLTTPISLRMLRVGERSGELGQMLMQSSAFYDEEISRWIDRFTRSFEPLLMAGIGLIVGLIVVLLYMPIFDLAGSLS
jgi:general secretion pathway protein F